MTQDKIRICELERQVETLGTLYTILSDIVIKEGLVTNEHIVEKYLEKKKKMEIEQAKEENKITLEAEINVE